jgi:hypothetical protein
MGFSRFSASAAASALNSLGYTRRSLSFFPIAFSFARLLQHRAQEAVVANTYELQRISLARCNTDKIDADKLRRIIKTQAMTGELMVSPVAIPPKEIQDPRGLFSTCRLYQKQNNQLKNRIHSLLKEQLYGFTQEEIFDRKKRGLIRGI